MVSRSGKALAPLMLAALAACGHHSPPAPAAPQDTTMTAQDSVRVAMFGAVPDPVGFLLENRDSLGLTPEQLDQLRAINLELYRVNARIQIRIDSIVPPPPPDYAYGRRPPDLTADQRDRLRTLIVARSGNIRRAREEARSVLTAEQRTRADAMEQRFRTQMQRGRGRRSPG